MSNNYIKKWWFYNLSDFSAKLKIEATEKVVIFDDGKSSVENIEVLWETDLKIYWFVKESRKLEIVWNGDKTSILANYLFLWKDDEKIEAWVKGKIISSWNNLEINILGILDDKSFLKLDSGVDIDFSRANPLSPPYQGEIEQTNCSSPDKGRLGGVSWELVYESFTSWSTNTEIVFLWNEARFSGIPGLRVATNQVKANHSLKIDKISDESLFYLEARWIDEKQSRNMLLKAKVDELYKYFRLCNEKVYEEVLGEIFRK